MPDQWNKSTQRVIESQGDKKALKAVKDINSELNRLESVVHAFAESCRILHKPILKDALKNELNAKTHRVAVEKTVADINLFDGIDILIKDAQEGIILTKEGKRYTPETCRNWSKSKDRLKEFNSNLTFEGITLETYFAFISYCNQREYSLNYIGKIIKDWKRFMKLAHDKKWHNNNIYNHEQFKKLSETVDKVYLNDQEIKLIKEVDLSNYPKMWDVIRDRYVINLYNGLRISDMKTFREENLLNNNMVHVNEKTDKKVVIPVHPVVQEIIAKYNGKLPRQYNDVLVNQIVKQIAKLAGLTKKERWVKTVGGKTVEFVNEKWELVTNHTARRSLTTNLLKHADAISVMPVTGMSLKTLQLYNKRSAEENAEMLKENPFFKK